MVIWNDRRRGKRDKGGIPPYFEGEWTRFDDAPRPETRVDEKGLTMSIISR